jgi:aldehyde:ferredoxin oxidoreductase
MIMNENKSELKEAITSCDWQSPNVHWTSMECEIYKTTTGIKVTEEELDVAARRIKNMFRVILIRNFGFEDFNYLVDLYYEQRDWDKKTGWPIHETLEKCGLKDVVDELEAIGKLPVIIIPITGPQ